MSTQTEVVNQDRPPNFRDENNSLYLVRCFACNADRGRENYVMMVASGQCAWCGWTETETETESP